jgi:hypothetical protein
MRFLRIGAILGSLSTLLACAPQSDPGAHQLKNIAGEDSSAALHLGQGYNPIDGTVKGFCVNVGALETQSGEQSGQIAQFRLLEIESESALREALNISASASFKGTLGQVSARANFAKSINKNSSSRYLLVHTSVANQLQIAKSFKFTDAALRLLKQNSTDSFLRHCGSEFVYGRRTGGEFFAVFEFSFLTSEEDRAMSAALSSSGAGWKVASDINRELSKFGRFASTQMKMYVVGGNSAFPQVDSLEAFALKFNTMVNLTAQGAVTLELLTKDYDGVEPIDLKPNTELLIRQRYVMEQLGIGRDAARELLNTVLVVKSYPEKFEPVELERLNQAEREIKAYLNTINDAAVACFENVVDNCKLPVISLPSVEIPKKRFETNCRSVPTPSCVLFDDQGSCISYKINNLNTCS